MDTKQYPTGVRPSGEKIQIRFKQSGDSKYTHETLRLKNTPANIKKAGELRKRIISAIKHGTFNYAEFFPDSPNAYVITIKSFAYYAQVWLDSPEHDWSERTRIKYKECLNLTWMPLLHGYAINQIKHSDLISALKYRMDNFKEAKGRDVSIALYNDWLTVIRGVFHAACMDDDSGVNVLNNPTIKLSNKKREHKEPDPFTIEEANLIIDDMYKNELPIWAAWFELGFYSGMRFPSEAAGLEWCNVDFRNNQFRVTQARNVYTESGFSKTKTRMQRTVDMNSRSLHALNIARSITGFNDTYVFMQGNDLVTSAKPQRAMWRACLKRLKIRYRDMYSMRHTFATFGLMSGLNPAYLAKMLGHRVDTFFKDYAKWIDSSGRDLQRQLMKDAIDKDKGILSKGKSVK